MTTPADAPYGLAATTLLRILRDQLDHTAPAPPQPGVSLLRVAEGTVGLGDFRGTQSLGTLGVAALKGIRLDAVARFQLWAAGLDAAEQLAAELYTRILAARSTLRAEHGVLRITPEDARPAEHLTTPDAWRKQVDYRVLFEFAYSDADGASSLISRIPVDSEMGDVGSESQETTTVTDELARWDNERAPHLSVRGPRLVGAAIALAFIPGTAPTGRVIVARTFDGAPDPPAEFLSLDAFVDAVSGPQPVTRHARTRLSLNEFLSQLGPAGTGVIIGDWDNDRVEDIYVPRQRTLDPPLELTSGADQFSITYEQAALDRTAVVYVRLRQAVSA